MTEKPAWTIIRAAHRPRRGLLEPISEGTRMLADVGNVAPNFNLISGDNEQISLSQFRGEKHVFLSFHIFDFTDG